MCGGDMDSSRSPLELYQQALKLSAGDRAVLAGLLPNQLAATGGFGSPLAAIGTVISATMAGVSVRRGRQEIGEGVRHAARSSSADTALRILFEHQSPGTVVHEAELHGTVNPAMTAGVRM